MAGREADLTGPESPILFNPSLLSGDDLIRSFLVRHAQLDELVELVRQAGEAPKHCLVLGEPGMGKTTLLRRVELKIQQDQALNRNWHPIRFDEEQYNLAGLADLWLNCLERLALKGFANASEILRRLEEATASHSSKPLTKEEARKLGDERLEVLRQLGAEEKLRFVLLVDNFDLVVERLDASEEAHRFREILQQEGWLLLIGATSRPIDATYDHRHPLYEMFRVVLLPPLTSEETRQVILGLGDRFPGARPIAEIVEKRERDLPNLRELVAGNLRLTIFLASVLRLSAELPVGRILYLLMDPFSGSFKQRVEELPPQGQRTLDALLRAWNPVTAEQVASALRLDRGVASGQLHRLVERGLVDKVGLPSRSLGFQARDRFFNLWYLMRGGRRDRSRLEFLLMFLELFQRRRRQRGAFEELVVRLERMEVISKQQAKELLELQSTPTAEQVILEENPEPRAHLLGLVKRNELTRARSEAEALLNWEDITSLAQAVLAHVLERLDDPEGALETLYESQKRRPHPRTQLEIIRLLLDLKRGADAEEELVQLSSDKSQRSISAPDLAAEIARLVRVGGEDLALAAQRTFRELRQRAMGDPRVLLASCEIEIASRRWTEAVSYFREACLAIRDDPEADGGAVLTMGLRLAALGHPREILDSLRVAGFAERWMPMAEALEVLSGHEDRLKELAPEIRSLVEMVMLRISDLNPADT